MRAYSTIGRILAIPFLPIHTPKQTHDKAVTAAAVNEFDFKLACQQCERPACRFAREPEVLGGGGQTAGLGEVVNNLKASSYMTELSKLLGKASLLTERSRVIDGRSAGLRPGGVAELDHVPYRRPALHNYFSLRLTLPRAAFIFFPLFFNYRN
jgi:hypothetical protein